jgi:hypothetical protein
MSSTTIVPVISLDAMLEPFGIPKFELANYLKDRGIIAGSFAMASLVPDFGPIGDMDIFHMIPQHISSCYTTNVARNAYFQSVSDWFTRYGYIEQDVSCLKQNSYDFSNYIYKVQTFEHNSSGKKIDFVHIHSCHYRNIFRHTDFMINDTYIQFKNNDSSVYTEEYISNDYDNLINKRLILLNIQDLFSIDYHFGTKRGQCCPLDSITAPKRLVRLQKYLSRGFNIIPKSLIRQISYDQYETIIVNEETYHSRLMEFIESD